jgi:hypothetical protein
VKSPVRSSRLPAIVAGARVTDARTLALSDRVFAIALYAATLAIGGWAPLVWLATPAVMRGRRAS